MTLKYYLSKLKVLYALPLVPAWTMENGEARVIPCEEMPAMLKARYQGVLDRVAFYYSYKPGQDEKRWRKIVEAFKS